MKYDSYRKLERNLDLLQYIEDHPELAKQEIADHFSISIRRLYAIKTSMKKREDMVKK
jgi:predicted DNA-binding transcriptional regulator YafY